MRKGWMALVNDDIVDSMLFYCNIAVALICAFVAYIYSFSANMNLGDRKILIRLGFFVGLMMSLLVTRVVSSAVSTIFVCFAKDYEILEVKIIWTEMAYVN
jgi:hypothetical protein